ncbi:MAG: choice-of-anchor tandem repeat GloVer-containing protein [Candidatus Sulfotelmatobacter sp.]
MRNHTPFAQFYSAGVGNLLFAIYLAFCTLGLAISAKAQETVPSLNTKGVLHNLIIPPHGAYPTAGTSRVSARPQEAAPALNAKEIVLHNFVSPPHGAYPANGVIRDLEGNLYGTTNGAYSDVGGGGSHNAGVVFKIDVCGKETVLYSFTGGADGSSPNGLILDWAGNLYGTASYGGASDAGVVFKIDTSGRETVLYSFTGGADGGNPNNVLRDWKGNLYGTTTSGGAAASPSGYGVVFKIDTSGHETTLNTFTGGTDGAYPNFNVTLDFSGNFYGTTDNGGVAAGQSGYGVVFKVDTSGHETTLYTFTGGTDGAYPNGVIRDFQGNLYGTTSDGGNAFGASGAGVVYKLDISGHETVLYTFTGGNDGGYSNAPVTRDLVGNLYGTAYGGAAELGVVFKVDTSGHETVLHTFTRGPYGNQPDFSGVILDEFGNLYGTTAFSGAGGQGAVYKLDAHGNATVVYAFSSITDGQYPYNNGVIVGPDGQLYGTTDYGGRHGAGVLYQLDRDGDEKVLYTFDFFTVRGYGQPTGTVTLDSAGNFYGTTFIGQADVFYGYGVVYKVDTAGHATVLHDFTNGVDAGNPYGGVILDSQGNVYGTASGGGALGAGVVFEIDTSGHETVLYTFTGGADGGGPYGSLIRDSAGNFYGTTNGGGGSGAGVVFKLDTSGHETVLYSFTGADGAYPFAGLIRDSAGNFYGTTNSGGASGAGVVFKLDTSGRYTALLAGPMAAIPSG